MSAASDPIGPEEIPLTPSQARTMRALERRVSDLAAKLVGKLQDVLGEDALRVEMLGVDPLGEPVEMIVEFGPQALAHGGPEAEHYYDRRFAMRVTRAGSNPAQGGLQ